MGVQPTDAFWLQIIETFHQRSQKHSAELITISSSASLESNIDEQNALLEDIISQELDVWLGWHFPEALCHEVLNMGLPIVHISETHIEHPLSVSPIGLGKVAEELAHYVAHLLNYQGDVLAVGGLLQGKVPDDGRSRFTGFSSAFRRYPNIRFHHIPTHWDEERVRSEIDDALRKQRYHVDAFIGFSDLLALIGRQALLEFGLGDANTPVFGINGDPPALAAIIEGQMCATIETSATHLANRAFDIALDIVYGQPYPAHFEYNPRLITNENAAKVAAEKLVAIANIPDRLIGLERQWRDEYRNFFGTSLDISRQIGSVLKPERLPIELAALIRGHFGYDHAELFTWSEHEQTLTLVTDEASKPGIRIPLLNAGVLSEALTRDKPVFLPDAQHSFRYARDPVYPETRSRVILPIRQGGRIIGLLDLHAARVVRATAQQLLGLQSLADQLGVAMQNAMLYQEALRAQAAAEKADHLKTRLLANISHDLRNPLHVILNSVEKLGGLGQSRDELGQIERNAAHLLRLINDLLDLSRAEIGELSITPEFIDPLATLKDAFDGMAASPTGDDSVLWQLDVADHLPMIQADPDRLRQILYNLLSNASKFTPAGQITLGAGIEAPYLHIWVQDTGDGIAAAQQERIFEPFMSISENGGRKGGLAGTGLGLSITRRLVALHHGLITVDSQPGKGSMFHVYLPLPNLSDMPYALPSDAPQHPVVLVVCERDEIAQDLADYWQRRGVGICVIRDERDIDDAITCGLPSFIAWDPRSASGNKWQIIQRLRSNAELCSLPFLLYDHLEGSSAQASVLLKPVKPKTLLNLLSTLFRGDENGNILIVDDDAEAVKLYRQVVTEQITGYACLTASNGREALAVMETVVPRIVILDLVMPEMDGFDVIEWMRADPRTRHVPVLVMSGKILTFEDIRRLEPYPKIVYQSKDVLSEDELASSLQQILFDNRTLPVQTSAVVKHALAYIHQNYAIQLSRSTIARQLGVSKNYLTQIFHQELGISLWDYLNRYRVMQAKELLRQTGSSIAAISSQVGFDDPAYFSRVFRRYVGQSPRMYRNTVE